MTDDTTAPASATGTSPPAGPAEPGRTRALFTACIGNTGPTATVPPKTSRIRAVGAGLPFGLGVALFGGTAPLVIEWLASRGLDGVSPWYVAALGAVTVVAVVPLRDRRDTDMRAP